MQKVGILIEFKDDEIKKTNYGVITLAREQGCELYALEARIQGSAQRFDGGRLRQPGHSLQQNVPLGQQADQQPGDHLGLPDNGLF